MHKKAQANFLFGADLMEYIVKDSRQPVRAKTSKCFDAQLVTTEVTSRL